MKRTLLLLGALATLTAAGFGQSSNAPGQAKKTPPPVDPIAVERAAVNNAITLATTTDLTKGNNLSTLEALLTAVDRSTPGSADWQMETAQRLLHIAEQVARAGKPGNVTALASRAVQYLAMVDSPAKEAKTRAAAKTLTAWVYERYLADRDSAQASYEAAAQLAPDNDKAKEAAERLKDTKNNAKQKPAHGG